MTDDAVLAALTRRCFLEGATLASAAVLLGACDGEETDEPEETRDKPAPAATAPERALRPTPACDNGDDPTPAQTEGPYFTPNSPERRDLAAAGIPGDRLELAGRVLDTSCRPIAGALLDFWQADGRGAYDNDGYRLRGHQFSDRRGRFRLSTVLPGRYPGRTPHIHVKVQRPRGKVLTTQLYFPGEGQNGADPIFDEELLVQLSRGGRRAEARFDFVLE
jgi:protocatechuate 3,4-dioxygenase beta subunit